MRPERERKMSFIVEKPSIGFVILGTAVMWFFAGFVTAQKSIKSRAAFNINNNSIIENNTDTNNNYEQAHGSMTNDNVKQIGMNYSMKVGFTWALIGMLFGMVMPTRTRMAYERLRRMNIRSLDLTVFLTIFSVSIILALIAGSVLTGWVMPKFDIAENFILAPNQTIGCLTTVAASIIPLPVIVRHVQTYK
jgi:hypothetical protein